MLRTFQLAVHVNKPQRQGLVPRFKRIGRPHCVVVELDEDLWDLAYFHNIQMGRKGGSTGGRLVG